MRRAAAHFRARGRDDIAEAIEAMAEQGAVFPPYALETKRAGG